MDLTRPLSWSAISSFRYNPEQWYKKYVLKEEQPASPAMLFGNYVGNLLATDPTYLPQVPRAEIFEYALTPRLGDIPLVGYIDSYTPHHTLHEYKTGQPLWSQNRADSHQQVDMYLLQLYLTDGVKPSEITPTIHWLPTQENSDFTVSLRSETAIHSFHTPRSMFQLLSFGQQVQKTWQDMQEYAKHY